MVTHTFISISCNNDLKVLLRCRYIHLINAPGKFKTTYVIISKTITLTNSIGIILKLNIAMNKKLANYL